MFSSRRSRAPAAGMGGGGYGAAPPPRRRGFGMGGGRRRAAATGGYGAEPISVGTSSGTVSGMAMAPTSGRVPRVRTRDRIKQFLGFGRSRRAAARTVMY